MAVFRQVAAEQAGPNALGILVPPGRRTLVIIRPRRLNCDLLPIDPEGSGPSRIAFLEIGQQEAPELAQKLQTALEEGAVHRTSRVEAVASPMGSGYEIWATMPPFSLLACPRRPGRPYQPLLVPMVDQGQELADQIAAVLCPTVPGRQELYVNTRNFSRQVDAYKR